MIETLAANFAPVMFAGLIAFLLYGFPVAFSLAACGLLFGFVGVELGLLPAALMQALPLRVFGILSNDTLLAIPFFTLMGLILERSGLAEDLLETVGQLFGPVRGGFAYAVIVVGAILACSTGVVAADVIAMGLVSLPLMLRYGYDRRVASGIIAASGTLAQIIPPSLVLIVIADQMGKSVGDMYAGAFIPGFGLAALYALFILGVSIFKPQWMPAMPKEARTFVEPDGSSGATSLLVLTGVSVLTGFGVVHQWVPDGTPRDSMAVIGLAAGLATAFSLAVIDKVAGTGALSAIARRVVFAAVPPLGLIVAVLGTVFLGVATPTEGGAFGCVGAMAMAAARGRLNVNLMKQAAEGTAKLSSFVMFILIGATVFSLVFQGIDGPKWVEHMMSGLPGGATGFVIASMLIVFALSFFLDFFEVAFIVVPLLAPVAQSMGIDLVWFGVLIAMNLQMSFMHPPFGFALFYLRSVAPAEPYSDKVTGKTIEPVTTAQICWGAVPFIFIQMTMCALIIAFPQLVTYAIEKPVAVMTQGEVNKALDSVGRAEDDVWGESGPAPETAKDNAVQVPAEPSASREEERVVVVDIAPKPQ